ncbi:MAG TPA: TVP38/TMEM64 family protein [Azospirillaceae bacterium]|nr:TVP38/TMEM64 family protein [Azospirillaceae bacterium]
MIPGRQDTAPGNTAPGDTVPGPGAGGRGWTRFLPLAVLAAGLAAFFALGLHEYLSWETLRRHRHELLAAVEAAPLRAALVFVAVYTAATAFSIPGAAFLSVGGGFLFGTAAGGALAVTGATLGAACVFLAARTAVGDYLQRRLGGTFRRLEDGFRENAFSYMLFLRLMPVFPFWFVNLAPAFLGVPLRTFVAGTFLGIIPGGLVYASVGSGLGHVLDAGGTPDLGLVARPEVLLPIAGLALLSLVPVVYRRFKSRADGTE